MNLPRQPIVSLSLNPAIDLSYEISELTHDHKTRANKTYFDAGGTGINVGVALQKLGVDAATCYIRAGQTGEILDALLKKQLNNLHAVSGSGETRINTTILQARGNHQYEINAAGPEISKTQLNKISHLFLGLCGKGIGILTGSLPPGAPLNTYNQINLALKKQGGQAIIDAPVDVLRCALESKPFLIKPNLHELQILQNRNLSTIEEVATEARKLVQQGIAYVCISLAGKGAILTAEKNSFYCPAPKITAYSTVGAGDSMVAALAYAFTQQQKPEQALTLAVACGASTAKQAGTQLFDTREIQALSDQIQLRTLDI